MRLVDPIEPRVGPNQRWRLFQKESGMFGLLRVRDGDSAVTSSYVTGSDRRGVGLYEHVEENIA